MSIKLDIATAPNAHSRRWQNKSVTWDWLSGKLSTPKITDETLAEYARKPKESRAEIKDVGGFVGGYLRGGRRKAAHLVTRQLVCLDLDTAQSSFFDTFSLMYSCEALIHSTHSHTEKAPRYRLVIPLNEGVTPDEYAAISRRLADNLGMSQFDPTTFQAERLMYWPSMSSDAEYYIQRQTGEFLDASEVLATYVDWRDASAWPTHPAEEERVNTALKKQQDPTEKKGFIGAFCRTYGISDAISAYLSDYYESTTHTDRFTFIGGSSACGLVVYEDTFAFSHHGTDPASGKLCNSFDLVRLHLFGDLDEGQRADTQLTKQASYKAMCELVGSDKATKKTLASERLEKAKADFGDFAQAETGEDLEEVSDIEWMSELEVDSRGKYLPNAANIIKAFKNDRRLKGAFTYNAFDKRVYINRAAWRELPEPEPMRNADHAGVRLLLDTTLGISSKEKVRDVLLVEAELNSSHPPKQYLDALVWDGVERLDSLFIDYYGADDTEYIRAVSRKFLTAAVARIYSPGCKFDYVLTLIGPEGKGKSTLGAVLGGAWFSDTFMGVEGKESFEQLQGAWILEIGELAGLSKSKVATVKHFISKQVDMFRPAFGEGVEQFPRSCIFYATTNEEAFLKGSTGNRRFWPVVTHTERAKKSAFTELAQDRDQLFAEAKHRYANGETLFLPTHIEDAARKVQSSHGERDDRQGLIEAYLKRALPANWDTLDSFERGIFLEGTDEGETLRSRVCVAEIWCECLGQPREKMNRYNTREINDILRVLPNWTQTKELKTFSLYGRQRHYTKLES